MPIGTIKAVKADGYGFLRPSGEMADIYFHRKALNGLTFDDQLVELEVEFEISEYNGRQRAVNVRRVEDVPQVRREG